MAGPPPSNLTLQERLMALAQTLQFAWFVGHVSLLLCTVRYGLSYLTFNYYSRWARFSYRTAFIAAAVTYGIVVYKGYRARMRQGKSTGALALLADENVQYLLMAFVWLFFRQIPLAVLPFTVYSVFHVMTYTRATILPTITPPPPGASPGAKPKASPLSDTIGNFVKNYYDQSMTLVAALEIALWFRILGSAVLFQSGSWILFATYTAFFRARYAQSSFVQSAVTFGTARLDATFANQSTPPAVRQGWETVKGLVRQAHDATDLKKYAGAGQQGAGNKKAQ
ncbi:hypothetical protein FKW77_002667 [Venturia effusa]|uniref:Nucleoporin POM33 n=1 Tax=Venturia effusa TaxID=50376 RepID=A0A517L4Y9_9PEZI|nr:hypothetical protein FKW77_002667 [Venturia effusa]